MGEVKMMRIFAIAVFSMFLNACNTESNKTTTTSMIQDNDPKVCAADDVKIEIIKSFGEGYKKYIDKGGKELELRKINSTGINSEVHEISCSAIIFLPSFKAENSTWPEDEFSIFYKVRPSLSEDNDFVLAAVQIENLEDFSFRLSMAINAAMAEKKGTQAAPEPQTPPQNVANASEMGVESFSAEEKALIGRAADAYGQMRNEGGDKAYEAHTKALDALEKKNICWGKVDEVEVEYAFHRCSSQSLQKQPT